MNQNAVFGDRSDDVRVAEIVDQAASRRVADVRRIDAGDIAVLREEFGLELFVVGTRVVEVLGSSSST